MGIWPDTNVGLGPKSLNENEFYGDHYNGFAIPSIETITKGGRTVRYELPNSALNSDGPMEWQLSSAGDQYWLLPTARLSGTMKVVKIVLGNKCFYQLCSVFTSFICGPVRVQLALKC